MRAEATLEAKLDNWLIGGAESFRRDPALHKALLAIAMHPDARACLLLLESVLETPGLPGRLLDLLRPGHGLEHIPDPRDPRTLAADSTSAAPKTSSQVLTSGVSHAR